MIPTLGPGWQLQTFTEQCVQWIRPGLVPNTIETIRLSRPASMLLTECYHFGCLEELVLESSTVILATVRAIESPAMRVKINLMSPDLRTVMEIRGELEEAHPKIAASYSLLLSVNAVLESQDVFARLSRVRP